MTTLPPPGAPFPYIGGRPIEPDRDPRDVLARSPAECLLDERIVLLSEHLTDQVAGRLVMELMALDASGDEPVHLNIDCRGGSLEAAFSVMDVIDALGVEVHTLCLGQVLGPPVGIVAVSHLRSAAQHSRLRLAEPRLEFAGRTRELELELAHHREQLTCFQERLSEASGRPVEVIAADMRRGRFLSAGEALDYGLVDEVVSAGARVLQFPRRFGFRPL